MKRILPFLLAGLSLCQAQDAIPAQTPDYKALYEIAVQRIKEANAVAVQWKEKAEKLETEKQELAAKVSDEKVKNDILRKQSVALGTEQIPAKPIMTTGGIPSDVVAKIEARVKAEYPDSYTTQKYLIQAEKKNYLEVNSKP